MKNKNLQYYVSTFLTTYLGGDRGLSENTSLSYNKAFQLLIPYLCTATGKPINKLSMDDFTIENVKGFLNSLEEAGNSISTRNQRLAAIKSFCRFVREDSPQDMYSLQQILNLKTKKSDTTELTYLSATQLGWLLEEPDYTNRYGFKDLVILTILSDTGVRVSEFINIRVSDVRTVSPAQILIHGKGGKTRWVPISTKASDLLKTYMEKENLLTVIQQERYLFVNRSGKQFTRAGITYILQKYIDLVHAKHPLEFPEKLSPHCLRHTKAMMLLEMNQNLIYIRDILGHEHMKTTEIYARTDSKQIRQAVEEASAAVPAVDSDKIDYKGNKELLSWLVNYCK